MPSVERAQEMLGRVQAARNKLPQSCHPFAVVRMDGYLETMVAFKNYHNDGSKNLASCSEHDYTLSQGGCQARIR